MFDRLSSLCMRGLNCSIFGKNDNQNIPENVQYFALKLLVVDKQPEDWF